MDKIWWGQVTNAVQFIRKIVESVLNEKHLAVELPRDIPWYDTMRELTEDAIRRRSSDRNLVSLQDSGQEPGKCVFEAFCDREKQSEYRPAVGYADFLAKCGDIVLNHRIVWVSDLAKQNYSAWIEFVSAYAAACKKERRAGGIFILELREQMALSAKKGVHMLSFQKEISHYDSIVFNMLAASSIKKSAISKEYLVELVSNIAGRDMELAAQCIRKYREFLNEPYVILQRITEQGCRSNGESFENQFREEEVKKQIWKAQIKIIFPLIEEFRGHFVDKYKEQIGRQLPIPYAYGEEFTEADEVEVGTLYFMACNEKLHISSEDYHKLKMFREARNRLAHLCILSDQEMEDIFSVF